MLQSDGNQLFFSPDDWCQILFPVALAVAADAVVSTATTLMVPSRFKRMQAAPVYKIHLRCNSCAKLTAVIDRERAIPSADV
jgi:hypothetical protein